MLNIYRSGMSRTAIMVYQYLYLRANGTGACWPKQNTIAEDLACSVSTVKRAIWELEKAGYLTRELRHRKDGGHTSNHYTLL